MKAGCQTRAPPDASRRAHAALGALAARDGIGARGAVMRARRAGKSCGDVLFLVPAAGAAAARRTSGRPAGLVTLPLFDRFAAEPPVAADAEPRQPSLSEQAVDRRRMNAQVFRQFLDRKNLIALRCLSHTLGGFTGKRRFLRRSFLHSTEPLWARFQVTRSSVCRSLSGVKTLCANNRSKLRVSAHESANLPQGKRLLCFF